ncbi:hypothetical protein [Haloflavibacter putidus]|uniref:Uncharacterized protein n=1 Tax=Haloflavibacter putidus TaxID=2576776 RepID=A0A507ZSY3_9FLAO|nr:hypothetical protein [Haloflavibacter putidus]TQD38828.1 hypothetical protein FKR84_07535 [Haloflavibacter putidus]
MKSLAYLNKVRRRDDKTMHLAIEELEKQIKKDDFTKPNPICCCIIYGFGFYSRLLIVKITLPALQENTRKV